MRASKIIHVVTCHAEGEVGDVIVGGVAPPPGGTLWEQFRFIANDGVLRNFLRHLAETGVRIIAAANEQFGFSYPEAGGWNHISFRQFAGPFTREDNELQGSNAVVVRPGKIYRSPTGIGCSPHGGFDRAGADDRGRRLSRPLPHRVGVRLPDRAGDHDRRPASHRVDYFGSGLDYRLESVYARCGRSVALRLPAHGYLATLKGGNPSVLRDLRSRLTRKWRWNTHFTTFCRSPKPILIISPEGWRKT